MDEGVTAQWQQVEVAYQARMDKTKNLFEIVTVYLVIIINLNYGRNLLLISL